MPDIQTITRKLLFFSLVVFAGCNAKTEKVSSADAADAIYYGGDILTMEGDTAQYAEAVAIKNDKIIFTGSKADADKMTGDHTVLNDLKGKTMMPGFIDPHLHPILGAVVLNTQFAAPFEWNFPWGTVKAVRGHEAFISKVKEYADELKNPTDQLIVWGYMEPFHGKISRSALDSISAIRPIMIWQYSAHEMFLNTAALKSFNITEAMTKGNTQVDFKKGRFVEAGFFTIVLPKLAKTILGAMAMKKGLERFRDVTHLGGVTTVGDLASGTSGSVETDLKILTPVLENNQTPFRVQLTPDCNTIGLQLGDGVKAVAYVKSLEQKSTPHFIFGHSIKLFSDGAFFGQAFQVEPPGYKDGHHGEWIMKPDRLEKSMRLWWNAGYTIHIHCNGSGGLAVILDALEEIERESPKTDHRLTIEHFGQSSSEQVKRIATLGALVSANPYYLYAMGDEFASGNLGPERASQMVRCGSLLENKIPFALHSDFTMAPVQPLLLAWIAVNRITSNGTLMAPEQRIPVYNALQAITSNAAFVLRMDDITGSIKTGKKADFVILAENPLKVDKMKIRDIKVLGTVFEGRSFPVN